MGRSIEPGMRRIVAVGELLWEVLPAGSRLGGTTANFVVACTRLGRSSAITTCLSADEWECGRVNR